MPMMNTQEPVDLRIRRTHKLLWEALLTLMTQQKFETISVKNICDQAMVHRTTFYKHYTDKYDLLTRGIQLMHELLLSELERTAEDASAYIRFFEFVALHERFYRVMLGGSGVQSYQTQLRNYFAEAIAADMQKSEKVGQTLSIPQSLQAHFYAGAIVSTLTWWLSTDLPYSAQQMGQYLRSLLGNASKIEKG